MPFQLIYHPFSSYCQKVLIALYENQVPFEPLPLAGAESPAQQLLAERWPIQRFPVLVDGDRTVMEATCIIEYLGLQHPGPVPMIPADAQAAIEVRMMDRCFDNYVSTPMQKLVYDARRPEADRDPYGVAEARRQLDTSYAWLNGVMAGRTWAAGDAFTLADCAAAPALFYADWCHAIDPALKHLTAYRQRLLARPSFARAVDEARPFRAYFPLGAPDRD
jgi:glutathione S-transferase